MEDRHKEIERGREKRVVDQHWAVRYDIHHTQVYIRVARPEESKEST